MKIAFISGEFRPETIGGTGIYVDKASRSLAAHGHHIEVFTATRGPASRTKKMASVYIAFRAPIAKDFPILFLPYWLNGTVLSALMSVKRLIYSMNPLKDARSCQNYLWLCGSMRRGSSLTNFILLGRRRLLKAVVVLRNPLLLSGYRSFLLDLIFGSTAGKFWRKLKVILTTL